MMRNYCTPGKDVTNEMVKSGKLFTYTMVKSAAPSTNCHSPQSKGEEEHFVTQRSANDLTTCTRKSACIDCTTLTLPYRGIPLQVQESLFMGLELTKTLSGSAA